jgi:uncharacterized protein (DUF1330 family)
VRCGAHAIGRERLIGFGAQVEYRQAPRPEAFWSSVCQSLEGRVTAYVIYQGEVLDQARYDEYKTKAADSIIAAGGRYLVRGGDIEVLEGDAPAGRTVVLEFPSREAAVAWYRGDAYSEIRKIREGAARARMYVVDGVV